jgi:iron(III) transport system permease protein
MARLSRQSRHILLVLIATAFGFVALPWYGIASGFWSFAWLTAPAESANAPGLIQALLHGRLWLWPLPVLLIIALIEALRRDGPRAPVIAWCGGL